MKLQRIVYFKKKKKEKSAINTKKEISRTEHHKSLFLQTTIEQTE